ncbi:hypothetical protein CR513_25493, partial [Mucuna pruriens]
MIDHRFSLRPKECMCEGATNGSLCALSIAPTQLHPNSWVFVRAFELLSEDLDREPALGVFFWFFSTRRTEKVGWTSLSSRHGH